MPDKNITKPGDLIQLSRKLIEGSNHVYMVYEDLELNTYRIVDVKDFEDLEYVTPQLNSSAQQEFEEGDYVIIGHISDYVSGLARK